MKIKVYSLLVSLVFIPVAILGQFLGLYLGKILYFIYEGVTSLRLPDFIADTGSAIVSGVIAGYFLALIVTKIYNNYNLLFATILPLVVILFSFIGDILLTADANWSTESIGSLLREVATIAVYYYLLKDKFFLRNTPDIYKWKSFSLIIDKNNWKEYVGLNNQFFNFFAKVDHLLS